MHSGGHSERHDDYLARFLRTGEKRVMGKKRELPARRKDGSEFWIELGLTEVRTEKGEERLFTGFLRDLSAIKRKQRLTAGILESSFDPIFAINSKGVITMTNNAATKQFGWTKEQFLNKDIAMIVGGGHAVDHSKYIKRYLRTGEKRVMGIKRELSARRADGSEFPIELGLAELSSELPGEKEREFVGFVRDISLEKKQEAELKQKQAFTEGLIEASLDAMFAIDEQGRIRMVNDAAVKQFQWSKEEFMGHNIVSTEFSSW
jgi:PAS domain S-box-containing protein